MKSQRQSEVTAKELQTKPPARYTEATLLSAMEGAGKLIDDEELRAAMQEKARHAGHTRVDHRRPDPAEIPGPRDKGAENLPPGVLADYAAQRSQRAGTDAG